MLQSNFEALLTTIAGLSTAILGLAGALDLRRLLRTKREDRRVSSSIFLIGVGLIVFCLLPLTFSVQTHYRPLLAVAGVCGLAFLLMSVWVSTRGIIKVIYPAIYWPLAALTLCAIGLAMYAGFILGEARAYPLLLSWYFVILIFRTWFFIANLSEAET